MGIYPIGAAWMKVDGWTGFLHYWVGSFMLLMSVFPHSCKNVVYSLPIFGIKCDGDKILVTNIAQYIMCKCNLPSMEVIFRHSPVYRAMIIRSRFALCNRLPSTKPCQPMCLILEAMICSVIKSKCQNKSSKAFSLTSSQVSYSTTDKNDYIKVSWAAASVLTHGLLTSFCSAYQ